MRWKMFGQSLGYKPSGLNSFLAVMVSYLANIAFPRLGEFSRAAIIKRYEKIPFSESFGTIVIERIVDLIALFVLSVIVLFAQFDVVKQFIINNPSLGDKFTNINISNTFIILSALIFAVVFMMFFILRKHLKKTKIYKKVVDTVKKFVEGIKSVKKIRNLPLFIGHTVFIWFMYFMMLYVTYSAFDFTQDLSLLTALTVFVFGSFGMVAPVQGGIGAWHFMVIGALVIYGIADEDAKAYALIVHGIQTLMLVVLGFLSLIALPLVNKK